MNTGLDEYVNLFLCSNAKFYIILIVLLFFLVGVTWWLVLLPIQSMGFGPQGQGEDRCHLQPGGPALSV